MLDRHFGTDPTVAAALSELKQLGYVTVPDSGPLNSPTSASRHQPGPNVRRHLCRALIYLGDAREANLKIFILGTNQEALL
jgi:hypothetical protein